jgi:GntR family transcriptional regulator
MLLHVSDHEGAVPPWRQLAAILRRGIADGTYAPGSRLPSIVTLAQTYELAPVTVRKALSSLRDEGLVTTESGWGTHVRGSAGGSGV